MIKKYAILIGIIIGLILLIIATFYYPGGSYADVKSVGFDWANNYVSNLLRPLAVNGAENAARPYAILGVLCLTAGFGLFFVKFSNRIHIKSASFVIKYLGILATISGFMTVIPSLHDMMVTASSILSLLIFFYITVVVLKSRLQLMKVVSIIFLSTFYVGAYMYFTKSYLVYLPIMQKIIFSMQIIWILSLEYFTDR